mmetsp:Transcript_74677/g.188784  ORF Transcript_74677/g.188784 Transcript_74677/m.188784 type:complete len:855 (+) Transcript_74677:107-2671(+)
MAATAAVTPSVAQRPLTWAEKELVRNRIASRAEACHNAAGLLGTAPGSWHESRDWRVQLGARSALAHHGAAHAPCAPEVRELLSFDDTGVRSLASASLRTAASAAAGAKQGDDESEPGGSVDTPGLRHARALLHSSDARVRRGACEAIGRQGLAAFADGGHHRSLAGEVAALLVDPTAAVRQAAMAALRSAGGPAAAKAVAGVLSGAAEGEVEGGQELLLDLVGDGPSGGCAAAEALLEAAREEAVADELRSPPASPQQGAGLPAVELRAGPREEQQQPAVHAPHQADGPTSPGPTMTTGHPSLSGDSSGASGGGGFDSKGKEGAGAASTLQPADMAAAERPSLPMLHGRGSTSSATGSAMGRTSLPQRNATQPTTSIAGRASLVGENAPPTGLEAELASTSANHRVAALDGLCSQPQSEAAQHMAVVAARLGDQEWQVRMAAARAMGHMGAEAAVRAEAVAACAQDRHSLLRQTCARALGRIGALGSAQRLAELLEDSDPDVRREAGRALGTLPSTGSQNSTGWRPEAAASAGALAAERLRHRDVAIRSAAQQALLEIQRQAAGAAAAGGKAAEAAAAAGVLQTLRPYIEPLLTDQEADARRAASEVLRRLGATRDDHVAAVSCAMAVLEDPSEEVRLSAVQELADLGRSGGAGWGATAAEALAQRLADDAAAVRRAAVEALAGLGGSSTGDLPKGGMSSVTVPSVVAGQLGHGLQTVRRAAAAALGRLGEEAARPHMIELQVALLRDELPEARCNAVEALAAIAEEGRLGSDVKAAVAALRIDTHWAVRRAVAQALHIFGPDETRTHGDALDVLRLDADWRVRRAASAALASFAATPHEGGAAATTRNGNAG